MKKIKALVSFVYIGANGSITSYAGGQVYEVANEIATQMISIGYAEEYSDGGGGSSDLTTANVVLKNSNSGRYFQVKPYKVIYIDGNDKLVVNNDYDQVSTEKTYSLVMYKGATFVPLASLQDFDYSTSPVIVGDAEVVMSPIMGINITGDCSITIKGIGGGMD